MNESEVFTNALIFATPAEQAAYLDEVCAGDQRLRAAVDALLRARASDPDFLEPPAASLTGTAGAVVADRATAPTAATASEQPGVVLAGRYKLLEEIGEGGMGTVWMAQQTEPVKRTVAVKLIKPGMDSRQVLARFEAERQALALMDHPNIAKVHDAGVGPNGRPFFVMELVKGVPITDYCDERMLTPQQRLELFVPVCHAVQHAHQKGIIHRDLKPSNVLVALYDDRPVPRVIDFGVAKATGQQLTNETLHTGFGAVVGTVEYMSPEQATFNQLDVDTRSDVYSLGVLMYELLTGTTPLDRRNRAETPLLELMRIVREDDTVRPSTRLSTVGGLPAIAARRGLEPKKLSGLVRGELDWIVMRALEKDRSRRYESAGALAQDVERYLADEPVLACPPSAAYRLRKFTRRNKGRLAVAAGVGLLVLGGGAFAWYSDRHAAQRQVRHEQNAEAVAGLLDLTEEELRADRADRAVIAFAAADRRTPDGGAEGLADRLARCRSDLHLLRELNEIDKFRWTWDDHGVPEPRLVAARWQAVLTDYGVTTVEGQSAEGAERVNRSLIRDRVLVALDEFLSIDRSVGVRAVLRSADPDTYRDDVRDAVAANDRNRITVLAQEPDALKQPARFAVVLGRLPGVPAVRGRTVLESALRSRTGDLGLLMALGHSYPIKRREGAGERVRWYQAALAAHPDNLAALNCLGVALRATGDLEGAIAAYREAIRLDPKYACIYANLGVALKARGELDEAIDAYRVAIRLDPTYAHAHSNLGLALRAKGDPNAAIVRIEEAIRLDPYYANYRISLGTILCDVKRNYPAAIACFEEAIRLDRTDADGHTNLGLALLESGEPDRAMAAFQEAVRVDPQHANSQSNLGYALLRRGDRVAAISRFREAIRLDPQHARAQFFLGNALFGQEDLIGAIEAYRVSIRLDPNFAPAHHNLGQALRDREEPDAAIASLREAIRLNPGFVSAHLKLGNILCDIKQDYAEAIVHFQEVIRLEPKAPDARVNLGIALRGSGDPDGAIAAFREAIHLNPRFAAAHFNLGATLCDEKQDYPGAIAAFETALQLNPKNARAHCCLGVALRGAGNLDRAIAAFREALQIDPEEADASAYLGVALVKRGELDAGVTALREAIRLNRDHAYAHNSLGSVLCDAKRDYAGAIAAFQEAIRINPKNTNAHTNLGNAQWAQGDLAGAIAAYTDAVRLNPRLAPVHNNLAWLLATGPDRVRDGKRAVEHAAKACELTGGKNPAYVESLAAAHAEVGDFGQAVEYQKKALSLRPTEKQSGKIDQDRLDLYSKKKPYRDPDLAPREVAPPPRKVKP